MSTLTIDATVGDVAHILYSAAATGRRAWSKGIGEEEDMAGADESTLSQNLGELFELLNSRNTSYLLVGGVALLSYVEGRNTEDIDLVLSLESLMTLPEIEIRDQNRDFARGQFRGVRVDLLLTANPLFRLVHECFATTKAFGGQTVRLATVEGLILLKLHALPDLYRRGEGQRIALYEADLTMLCHRYRPNLEPLFTQLTPHVDAGALAESRNIMMDIAARIARMDQAAGSQ